MEGDLTMQTSSLRHTVIFLALTTLAIGVLLIGGCSKKQSQEQADQKAMTQSEGETLTSQLQNHNAEWLKNAPQATVSAFEEGVKEIKESGILEQAIHEGQMAPDFSLPDIKGDTVRLSDLLKSGPVVIIWYRGGWCPYCNLQLRAMTKVAPQIKSLGATLVAISPQLPDSSISTAEKDTLNFTVLSDVGNRVASEYKIVYTIPEVMLEKLQGHLDLAGYNGSDSTQLPLAVTYIVDTTGTVRYAFLSADYRVRAEPSVIVSELQKLEKPAM